MSEIMKCFIFISFFLFFFREILCIRLYGDYYIENEGYIPAALFDDPISYEAHLTRTQYNKLIVGRYYFSRKVGPIGLHIALKRESDGTRINEIKIKNVCKMDYPLEPFTTKFSGIIDEDCCIEAGNYTLTNWSLEEHMRPQLKSFWYGKFIANLRFMENNTEIVLDQDLVLVFKDRDLKKFEEKHVNPKDVHHQEGSKKRKKKKNQGQSEGESINPPKLGEDINTKFGEGVNPKVPNVEGSPKFGDVNSKVPKAGGNMNPKFGNDGNSNVPKVGESMNPKVPNVGENMNTKLGEDTNSKIPKVGESMTPEVPTVPKVPKAPENRKRRPKRISPGK